MKISELINKKKTIDSNKNKKDINLHSKLQEAKTLKPKKIKLSDRITIDGVTYHIVDKEPIGRVDLKHQFVYFNGNRYKNIDGLYINIDTRLIKVNNDADVFGLKDDCFIYNITTKEMYRIKNGFRVNEDYVKNSSRYKSDIVIRNGHLFRVYRGEPNVILCRIFDDINQAKGSRDEYVYIRTLGRYYKNDGNYFIDLDSNDVILFNNISNLPVGSRVIYKKQNYIVYKNKDDKAILALVGSNIDNGITYEDGEFYFYVDGIKYSTNDLKGFEDYKFKYKTITKGKYVISKNVVLSSKYFKDFDEVYLYKPNEGKTSIKANIPIFFNQTEISIDKAKVFISIIYFNERFYIKDYKCLNKN